MKPKYSLDKIKFAVDSPVFERAVELYEAGKVTEFKEDLDDYSAVVLGTHPYNVSVSARYHDHGNCSCYLGQRDELCKHIVAVAIYAVMDGKELSDGDKEIFDGPVCSGKPGELSKEKLAETKKAITSAMKYIKPYTGPSRIWFAYQNSLDEGCARLSKIVSELPASEQTAKLLIDILLRLDKKLCNGVDDSDGIVGGFIDELVEVLRKYAELDPECIEAFKKLRGREICFDWYEPLLEMLDE